MRKVNLLIAILTFCALTAAPVLATPTFEFTKSQLLAFEKTAGSGELLKVTESSGNYDGHLLTGDVGFVGYTYTGEWIAIGNTNITDLSGYTDFSMTIYNDNDDSWSYKLFIETVSTSYASPTLISLSTGETATLNLDLSLIPDLDFVKSIGLKLTPFGTIDFFHTSATASTPAPGAILLGGIGVCLVGWLRRTHSL